MKNCTKTGLLLILGTLLALSVPLSMWGGQNSQPQQPSTPSNTQQNPPPASSQSAPASPASNSQEASPSPSLRNAQGATPAPPSAEETQAYLAIQKELNPDKQLQLVKDFEQKHPNSVLLSDVCFFGASAAEQKNDVPAALGFGQKSLQLRPDNLRSLILMASLLPLPQALQGTDSQKEQQLDISQSDSQHALQLLSGLKPPPGTSEDQFKKSKSMVESQIHAALGMSHLEKAILAVKDQAPPELAADKKSQSQESDAGPNEALQSYQQAQNYERQGRIDDAIGAYTQAAQEGQGTDIAQYANNMVQQLNTEKTELAAAEQEFKTAIASPQPNPQDYYRLGEVYVREAKLDDAINVFTQAAQTGQGTLLERYADGMVQKLKAEKAQTANPPPAKKP